VLVLDEADQLLEMGFRNDIMEILSHLPPSKQTFLFSATMPPDLRAVMAKAMRPGFATVAPRAPAPSKPEIYRADPEFGSSLRLL
jgi:superfamily II DNA/RNA helicase